MRAYKILSANENNKVDGRDESMIVIEFREAGTTGEYYSGITHNCSKDGFVFESDTLGLPPSTMLDFKLKHPDRDETINCLGDVAWTTKQKNGFVAEVKLHNIPTEKQTFLAEIMPPHPAADSANRKDLKPSQSLSAEDGNPAQNGSYSGRITESIVAAVLKNSTNVTGSSADRDIPEPVPIKVRIEQSGFESKVKNKQGKKLPILITGLIVIASAVLAGYLTHNSSIEWLKERSSSLLMSGSAVSVIPQEDELLSSEIKEQANPQFEEAPIITEPENTLIDKVTIAADGVRPSGSMPTESVEETVDSTKNKLDRSEQIEASFNPEADDLILDKDTPTESLNKGVRTGETVTSDRFIIHVSSWKTKEYAILMYKKVMSLYPDAIMVFENNYSIVMIPNIASHEKAVSISEELADKFDISPLIYVQKRKI